MKIGGTVINYYFHCKRQCWLFSNRINLEDNSEDVHIGRIIHELKSEGNKKTEIMIDNVKVDKITDEYLIEIKKSDSDVEAAKWQTLFYLKKLKDKGINRKGKLEFDERNKQDKKIIHLELTDEIEKDLESLIIKIDNLVRQPIIPEPEKDKKCKKCAYYEYCFI